VTVREFLKQFKDPHKLSVWFFSLDDTIAVTIDHALLEQLRSNREWFDSKNHRYVVDNADSKMDVVDDEEYKHSVDEQPFRDNILSEDDVGKDVGRVPH